MKGFTLAELMIAMAIGVGLIAAVITVYVQGRAAYRVNESVARLQEQGRFALAAIEPDLEMAGLLGFTHDAARISLVQGGDLSAVIADAQRMRQSSPAVTQVPVGAHACGENFALDVLRPAEGTNNGFSLACRPYQSGAAARADTLTVRRTDTREALPEPNRLQLFTSRLTSQSSQALFFDGVAPGALDENHRVHNLLVRSYYVARDSVGRRNFPALRVKTLARSGAALAFDEDEVISGIEDLQVQFGTGVRYVNPESAELESSPVVAVRVWLRVRTDEPDPAFLDDRVYRYADVTYRPAGADRHFRRAVIERTVAVRNARRP